MVYQNHFLSVGIPRDKVGSNEIVFVPIKKLAIIGLNVSLCSLEHTDITSFSQTPRFFISIAILMVCIRKSL